MRNARRLGVCALVLCMLCAVLTVTGSTIDQITLAEIIQVPLSWDPINGSNNSTNLIPRDTILVYKTNEGRFGALQITAYGRDLTLSWRTFKSDGTLHSTGRNLVVKGSYYCDLDQGSAGGGSPSADFQWRMVTSSKRYITPVNQAEFALLPVQMLPGGIFGPQPITRVSYSASPPRSIEIVVPNISLHVDLRHHLPWSAAHGAEVRAWTQWNITLPQPGTSEQLSKPLQCSCFFQSLTQWSIKPVTYWPVARQYLISDPAKDAWSTFALCLDFPKFDWGTGTGYTVSLVPTSVFSSYRDGLGVPVAPGDKYPISPAPSVELGPMNKKGFIKHPYSAHIRFDDVALEWFDWSGKARLRAGNVVLFNNLSWSWDTTNPDAMRIHLGWGSFLVDLAAKTVQFVYHKYPQPQTVHPTSLSVTVDEGGGYFIPLEPDLWL